MADNLGYTPGSGATVASDDIGGVQYQRVKIGVGADGVAVDVSATDPMPVLVSDPSPATSFGPITTANVVLFTAIDTANERSIVLQLSGLWDGAIYLQASQDGTNWFDAPGTCATNEIVPTSTFYSPCLIVIPATARYFRAITSLDFSGTVSGLYSQRAFDVAPFFVRNTLTDVSSDVRMPVAGLDPQGNLKQIALSETGQVMPADNRVIQGSLTRIGTMWQVETTGYNSISVQVFAQAAFTATLTFQASNDATTWFGVAGWRIDGNQSSTTTATAATHLLFPAAGRYFRVQVTAYTSGVPAAIGVLKSAPAWYPANTPSFNLSTIATNGVVTAATGVLAVGGNIAAGVAPTANPVLVAGWDNLATRRILTHDTGAVIVQPWGGGTVTTTVTRPADTAVYAANDAWSDSTSAPTANGFTLSSMARASAGSGMIDDIVIISSNDPATPLQGELWFFESNSVTALNDNAAFALSDSDSNALVGVVPFTLLSTTAGSGTNSYVHLTKVELAYTCIGSANLRFLIKVKNAYTPASSEQLRVRCKIRWTS